MVKYPTIRTALIKYQYFFITCFSWRQSPLLGMLKIKQLLLLSLSFDCVPPRVLNIFCDVL